MMDNGDEKTFPILRIEKGVLRPCEFQQMILEMRNKIVSAMIILWKEKVNKLKCFLLE